MFRKEVCFVRAAVDPSNRLIRCIDAVPRRRNRPFLVRVRMLLDGRGARVTPGLRRCEPKWHRGLELCIYLTTWRNFHIPFTRNERADYLAGPRARSCDVVDRAFPRPRDRKRIDRADFRVGRVRSARLARYFRRPSAIFARSDIARAREVRSVSFSLCPS